MKNIKLLLFVFSVLLSISAYSGEEEFKERMQPIVINTDLAIEDPNYFAPNSSIVNPRTELRLGIDDDVILANPLWFRYEASIEVTTRNLTTGTDNVPYIVDMDIEYSPFGNVGNLQDLMVKELNGVQAVRVRVLNYTITNMNNGFPVGGATPENVYLELVYKVDRSYDLTIQLPQLSHSYVTIDANNIETLSTTLPASGANELQIDWTNIVGAEAFDLEWTWLDNYPELDTDPFLNPSDINLTERQFKHNSSRIRTKELSYRIPLIYANGYLIYRIRAIARREDNTSKVFYGEWTSGNNEKEFIGDWPNYAEVKPHEKGKNWQLEVNYAEDAKNKVVMSYFDGTLRNRQTVTKLNSVNNTIVQELMYDNQGRVAIEVLPSPSGNSALRFYDRFNVNTLPADQRTIYSHLDFDWDDPLGTDQCVTNLRGMHKESGASKYYSDNNDIQNNFQDFVPRANNYPFVQREYTPDKTGRISRKSGVGRRHRLDTGKEMKYYYGQPAQIELNRLFGYKVGYEKHYKKNMTIDPNGQGSVNYLDPRGNVIATALVGIDPSALRPLQDERNDDLHGFILEDLLNKVNEDDPDTNEDNNILYSTGLFTPLNDGLNMYSQILVPENLSEYSFEYKFRNDETFTYECSEEYPFVYDLAINVTDNCGEDATNGGSVEITIDTSYEHLFNTTLSQGNYAVSKDLKVNEAALLSYVDEYLANTECLLSPEDFRPTSEFSGCFISCQECLDSLGSLADYQADRFNELANSGEVITPDQIPDFEAIFENEWNAFAEACNRPCEGGDFNFTCDLNRQRLLQDFFPDDQYATYDDVEPDDNGDGIDDEYSELSIYHPTSLLPNAPTDGTLIWQNPISPYMDNFGNPAHVNVLVTEVAGVRTYSPEIDEAADPNYATAQPDLEGFIQVVPNHLIHSADFILNWSNSWAESLLDYHPEKCYLDYYTEICTNDGGTGQTSSEYDSYLGSLTTYADATTLLSNPTAIMDNDPFFDIIYTVLGEDSNYLNNRIAIMEQDLTTDTPETGLAIWKKVYSTIKCGNPELYGCDTNITFSQAMSNMNTQERDDFWLRYKIFYNDAKEKILYVFSNVYAAQNGCLNGCIGDQEDDSFDNVINAYAQHSFVLGAISGAPAGYCNDTNLAGLYESKERRYLSYDYFYDSSASTQDGADAAVSDADYLFWEQTGKCPLVMDFQNFLHGAFLNENDPATPSMFGVGATDSQYLTTDLYVALGGLVDYGVEPVIPSGAVIKGLANGYTLTFTVADSNDQDNSTANGETCDFTLTNPNTLNDPTTGSPYNFSFDTYGSNWRIISMDEAYYVPNSYANTGTFQYLVVATVEQLPSGEIVEVLMNGATCAAIGECGVGPGHVGQDLDGNVDDTVGDAGGCTDLSNFEEGMVDVLNFLISLDKLNTTMPFVLNNDTIGDNGVITLAFTNDFLLNFFNVGAGDELIWEYNGLTTYTLRKNNIPIFVLQGIDFTSYDPEQFVDLTVVQDASGPLYSGVVKFKEDLFSTSGVTLTHSGSTVGQDLDCCIEGGTTLPTIGMVLYNRDIGVGATRNFITFAPKTLGYFVGEELDIQFSVETTPFIDGATDSSLFLTMTDVLNATMTINGEVFSLADNTLRVNYSVDVTGTGDRSIMDYDWLRGRHNGGLVWNQQFHGDYEMEYLNYTINGNTMNFPFDEGSGNPFDATDTTEMVINPTTGNNDVWLAPVGGNDRILMHDDHWANWSDGFQYDFGGVTNNNVQIDTKVKLLSIPVAFTGFADFAHIASITSAQPLVNDQQYISQVMIWNTEPFIEDPGCADCIVQVVAPVSCDEKYDVFLTHFGPNATTPIVSDYIMPELYDRDYFCNMKLGYLVDNYIYYLNALGITSTNDFNFITIAEFGSTDLHVGYDDAETPENDMHTVIDQFAAYIADNVGQADLLSWGQYIREVYLPANENICLPAPLFIETIELDPSEVTQPCMEFLLNIENTYQEDLYDQYIEIKRQEFIQNYIQEAMSSAIENFEMNKPDKEYQYTLKYYDQVGNLVQTVSPEGVDRLGDDVGEDITQITNEVNISRDTNPDNEADQSGTGVVILPDHELKTRYKYNTLNQLIWQETPDGGITKYAYDKLGKVIASQNAKQAVPYAPDLGGPRPIPYNRFSYTIYDDLGRNIEAGEKHVFITEQYEINDEGRLIKAGVVQDGFENATPNSFFDREVTKTIYDEAFLVTNSGTLSSDVVNWHDENTVRNRTVGIKYFEEFVPGVTQETAYDNAILYAYDIHGNINEMVNYINDPVLVQLDQHIKRTNYYYDLISGNVNEVWYQKDEADQFIHRYIYDADNRIVSVETSNDNVIWEKDANYDYYEHGPLARTTLGDKKVQGQDFAYTIQGWLKGVNSETLDDNDMGIDGYVGVHQTTARDAFGYSLAHFNNDYNSRFGNNDFLGFSNNNTITHSNRNLFNGNIKEMITSMRNLNERVLPTQVSNFSYDQLNRIRTMESSLVRLRPNGNLRIREGYSASYQYDRNGNLSRLTRTGKRNNWNAPAVEMDDLRYRYYNGTNQLRRVRDLVSGDPFTEDVSDQPQNNYQYDEIGQLVSNEEEGLDIEWRVDGKVSAINKSTTERIEFKYDGLGNRIAKQVSNGFSRSVNTTYYARDAEGRVMSTFDKQSTLVFGGIANTIRLKEHHIYGKERLGLQEYADQVLASNSPFDIIISPFNNRAITTQNNVVLSNGTALNFDGTLNGSWINTIPFSTANGQTYEVSTKLKVTNPPVNVGTVAEFNSGGLGGPSLARYRTQLQIVNNAGEFRPRLVIQTTGNFQGGAQIVVSSINLPITAGTTNTTMDIAYNVTALGNNDYDASLVFNGNNYSTTDGTLTISTLTGTNPSFTLAVSTIPGTNANDLQFELCDLIYGFNGTAEVVDLNTVGVNPTLTSGGTINLNNTDPSYWVNSICEVIPPDGDNDGVEDAVDVDDDNDGILDTVEVNSSFDIDADDDGIPDNVEAQDTFAYIAPSGVDADANGMDDAYDAIGGLTPIDTDGDGIFDYLDTDSDNDSVLDVIESHDVDHNGIADQVFSGIDSDNDGLDDAFEGGNALDGFDVNDEINVPATDLRNTDAAVINDDLDYRDIDDDQDGYLTIEEDLNGDGDLSNDDEDNDGWVDYLDLEDNDPTVPGISTIEDYSRLVGDKRYELKNHLKNILVVTSDRKLLNVRGGNLFFKPDVLSFQDYYAFGMLQPGRKGNAGQYRYGFQEQEQDDEILGDGNSVNYEYRMLDSRIGRFFAVDPLADDYPYLSTYAFSGNRVIDALELEGLEPIVVNGELVGYEVQPGQGPSQIAADINNIETQKEYGYHQQEPVTWSRVVDWNFNAFKRKGDWKDNPNGIFDKHAEEFTRLNLNPGDILYINHYADIETTIIFDGDISGINDPTIQRAIVATIGGTAAGMKKTGGTFRATNGKYNGNKISFKHYESGWGGGSKAKIKTYSMQKYGRGLGRLGWAGTIIFGGYDIYSSYEEDGRTYGNETEKAVGRVSGGIAGGVMGAKIGAAVGALFGGVGAIPGAIIGGFIGGWLGSEAGEHIVEKVQESRSLEEIRQFEHEINRPRGILIPIHNGNN